MTPLPPTKRRCSALAFSLVEMLITIAVIGILASLAIAGFSDVVRASQEIKNQANARHIAEVSSSLGAIGVPHVLPESLGGAEGTARLLRRGVTVTHGSLAGETFLISNLSNQEIAAAAKYLDVIFDLQEVRLVYHSHPGS